MQSATAELLPSNAKPVKVALWCHPRSTSTALTMCLSAIEGLDVHFEYFCTALHFRQMFFNWTGRNLSMELAGNESTYEEANVLHEKKKGSTFDLRRVSFDSIKKELENAKSRYVLYKDMAYTLDFFRSYIPDGFKHTFLIREPSGAFASFRNIAMEMNTNVPPFDLSEYDMIRHGELNFNPLLWYEKLHELWNYVKENIDENPVIIDSSDLITHPKRIVKSYCKAVGFPYGDHLLQWEPTPKGPNYFFTPGEGFFQEWRSFFKTTFETSGFLASPVPQTGPIPRDQLTDDVIRCVDHSMPFYREMFEHRLQA